MFLNSQSWSLLTDKITIRAVHVSNYLALLAIQFRAKPNSGAIALLEVRYEIHFKCPKIS